MLEYRPKLWGNRKISTRGMIVSHVSQWMFHMMFSNYERYRRQQLQLCKKFSKNEWTINLTVWCSLLVSIKNFFFGIFWRQELYELKKEPNKRSFKFNTTSKMRFFDPLCHTLLFFLWYLPLCHPLKEKWQTME